MRRASDPKDPQEDYGPRPAYHLTRASVAMLVLAVVIILVLWLLS